MLDEELKELVAELRRVGTDHADVEAKASRADLPKRMWETLSAFANTQEGGVLILGLDESRGFAATGVDNPKKVQQDLASVCDEMVPPLRPHIALHRFEGVLLVVAEIPEVERGQKPCFYKGAGQSNGSFVRVADGNRRLTGYEVSLLIAARGQPREDESPVDRAATSDLDPALTRALVEKVRSENANFGRATNAEMLRTLRVVMNIGGKDRPTLAGLLALGRFPQSFFPALNVHFVVYPRDEIGAPGPNDERFVDNRRFDGPVSAMWTACLAAVRQNMARRTRVRGATREDVWQYPETALREAVANALVHRDLSAGARGTPVQIHMFSDRLEIINPGGLYGPVTIESLGVTGVSAARNATLLRILEDTPTVSGAPVCENRGSGIGAMIAALRGAGLEPPRFDDSIATFRVTFPNTSLLDDETLDWLKRVAGDKLTETQRLGLALLRHRDVLDNISYRQATNLDSRDATKELRDLVVHGLIEQIGTKRWTTYRLVSGGAKRRDRRGEILSLLRQKGELSRADVARALELSDGAVRQWLAIMRREGSVEVTGPVRSRNVKYRVAPSRRRRRR